VNNYSFSVIIPSLNEAKYLPRLLETLTKQEYPSNLIEVIVADNGSTDESGIIAQKFGARFLVFTDVTVGALRNLGVRNSHNEIIAFLDADCIPTSTWLASANHRLQDILCVTGSKVVSPPSDGWIGRLWFGRGSQEAREVTMINSGNLIVPADVFQTLGGFREDLLSGEDSEFCERAKKIVPIISDPQVEAEHLGNPKTVKGFIYREFWHGLGALGSFQVNRMDRPLIVTVAFIATYGMLVFGLCLLPFLFVWSLKLVLLAILIQIALVAAVGCAKRKNAQSFQEYLLICALYWLYFSARSGALLAHLLCEDPKKFIVRSYR